MIKRVTVISLPDGTNPDEFWDYWIKNHADDMKKASGQTLRRYVINRVTRIMGGKQSFWGLVETYWDSEEDILQAARGKQSTLAAGGTNIQSDFLSRTTGYFSAIVEEKVILDRQ